MTKVTGGIIDNIRAARLAAIYICSHLLDPKELVLGTSCFYVDDKLFWVDQGGFESDWWANEECDFDQCAESVCDFAYRVMNNGGEFMHDFTMRYDYYDIAI